MYGSRGGGVAVGGATGGGLAMTGAPIAIAIVSALVLMAAGLLMLRWGRVRRSRP